MVLHRLGSRCPLQIARGVKRTCRVTPTVRNTDFALERACRKSRLSPGMHCPSEVEPFHFLRQRSRRPFDGDDVLAYLSSGVMTVKMSVEIKSNECGDPGKRRLRSVERRRRTRSES